MGDKDKGASAPRKPRERKISLRNLTRPKAKQSDQQQHPPLPIPPPGLVAASGKQPSPPPGSDSAIQTGAQVQMPRSSRCQSPSSQRPTSHVTASQPKRARDGISPSSSNSMASAPSNDSIASASGSPNSSPTSPVPKPPPNAWLSRPGMSSTRGRSGSVGSQEASSKGASVSPQTLTLSRSTSSASNLASAASASPNLTTGRKRSNTWRRIMSGNTGKLDGDDEMTSGDQPSPSTRSSSKGQRSSVFEAFRDTAEGGEDRAQAQAQASQTRDLREHLSPKQNNRKSFLSRGNTSSQQSETAMGVSSTIASSQPPKGNGPMRTLRRMSSKPLMASSYESNTHTNASRDSLVTSSENPATSVSSTPGMARRASNAMERALPGWLSSGKDKDKGGHSAAARRGSECSSNGASQGWTDAGEETRRPALKPSSESLASRYADRVNGMPPTSNTSSAGLQVPNGAVSSTNDNDVETLAENSNNEGIPKRLSGWLLNMLGNESPSARQPAPGLGGSQREDASTSLTPDSRGASAGLENTPLSEKTSTSSLGNGPMPKPKSGNGLLSNFSSSARARAAAAAALGSAGLDKAIGYLAEDTQNEDIWLLGVRHSLVSTTAGSEPLGPAIEIISPSPAKTSAAASPSLNDERSRDVPSSPTSSRHGGLSDADRSTRETTPSSIGTTSTVDSVGSASNASDRRPSTHTSRPRVEDSRRVHSVSPSSASGMSIDSRQSDRDSNRSYTSHNKRMSAAGASADPESKASAAVQQRSSQPTSATPNPLSRQASFQNDFSSRVWCTYRSSFVPIARDGSISKDAEGAAALAGSSTSSAGQERIVSASATLSHLEEVKTAPQTPTGNQRGWLGKRLGDASVNGTPAGQQRSPSLGTALGVSPSASPGLASGTSLSEKMGIPNFWGRATAVVQATGLAGRSGLTTDAGWGCMLRTGQSLLANALIEVHLGREWRRRGQPLASSEAPADAEEHRAWREHRAQYATYVRILSWFFDEPSTACPFGIHRMAREGKRLGKEVGEWFGPSTAAGAIKKLVDEYDQAGLGVSVATDGVVYLSDVYQAAAAVRPRDRPSKSREKTPTSSSKAWHRPVIILIGIRLGLEGVNPMYYESVQRIFTFPQSVGVAGGRPSSSYYFVGYQGNSLFYLDPHHVRPAVPFKHPPAGQQNGQRHAETDDSADEWWAQVYSEAELSTFHCDRPKRMPMRSLDPSMLLGFLVTDEASLLDLTTRVRALPKPIFAIQNEPPKWMRGDDDDFEGSGDENDPSLESFSESSQVGETEERDESDDEDGERNLRQSAHQVEGSSSTPPETPTATDDTVGLKRMELHPRDLRKSGTFATDGGINVPGIQISSASSGSIAVQHEFPRRRSRDISSSLMTREGSRGLGSRDTTAISPSFPNRVQAPRYHSDVRFPSTSSNATARQASGASTTRQPSDSYIAVDEEDSDGDLVACLGESSESASASVSPESIAEGRGPREPTESRDDDLANKESLVNSQVHGLAIQVPSIGKDAVHTVDSAGGRDAFPASTSWEEVPINIRSSPPGPMLSSDDRLRAMYSRNSYDLHPSSDTADSSSGYHTAFEPANIPRTNWMNFRSAASRDSDTRSQGFDPSSSSLEEEYVGETTANTLARAPSIPDDSLEMDSFDQDEIVNVRRRLHPQPQPREEERMRKTP